MSGLAAEDIERRHSFASRGPIQLYMPSWIDPSDPNPDDPSAYEGLPTDWPHNADCEACMDYEVYVESSLSESLDRRVKVGDRNGERGWWTWESRVWNDSGFGVKWPRRHRSLLDHRYAVRRAKLGADAAPDDAGATRTGGD